MHSYVTIDKEGALKRAEEVQKMIDDGTLTESSCRCSGGNQGQYVHERDENNLQFQNIWIILFRPLLQRQC